MVVKVNGSTVTRSTTNGWEYYDTVNNGAYIQFFGTAIPTTGDSISVSYVPYAPT